MPSDYIGSFNGIGSASGGFTGINIFDTNVPGQVINSAVINPYSVLTNPAYWRTMNFLALNMSSFPRTVRRIGVPLDVPHRLDRSLSLRPNGYQNNATFWTTFYFHRFHYGNAYARIKQTPQGPTYHNLLPDDVVPFRYDDAQYFALRSTQEILADDEVLKLSSLSFDGMAGFNPVWLCRETFQRGLMQDRYITRFISRGTVMRGSIEIPTAATPEQVEAIVNLIRKQFSGADADRDVIVLSGGATLNNKTLSPEQSQLIQLTEYSEKQISQITGVDQAFLMDSKNLRYNGNIQDLYEAAMRDTFRPEIDQVGDELSLKLLTTSELASGLRIHLDPSAFLRGDIKTMTEITLARVAGGVISKNEGRAVFGYDRDKDPDSDKLKTLGDTAPPLPALSSNHAAAPAPDRDHFAALKPLLHAAVDRVETKTAKAFSAKEGKTPQERTIWANVFAVEQANYIVEAIQPVAAAIQQLTGKTTDIHSISDKYAAAIRRQAATGETADLQAIIGEIQ